MHDIFTERVRRGFEPSHLLADTCVAVCLDGAMRFADSSCGNASGLFQVWYIRSLSIKQEDLILSIEVTAYTSADQPVKHVAGSGEVYMDFGTAMEISVVTVSACGSTGSNTQIMLRVVSLEEELLDVPEYQRVPIGVDNILVSQEGQPLFRSHTCLCLICEFGRVLCPSRGYLGLQVQRFCAQSAWSLRSDGRDGARWPWLSSRPDRALRRPHGQFQRNRYRRVPHAETDDVEVVACGSLRAHSVWVP